MQENDQHEKSSIYDFIYVDIGKLRSYYSQLDESGLLNTITTSTTNISDKIGKFGAGKNPIVELSSETKTSSANNLTQVFDHQESLSFKSIEVLNAAGLINRDISEAKYGQLVLTSGNAKMYDLSMLHSSWGDIVKSFAKTENSRGKPQKAVISPEEKMIIKMLESMDPLMSFKIKDSHENTSWAAMEPRHLIGDPFGYFLKHGTVLRGNWHVLGILEAIPLDSPIDDDAYPEDDILSSLADIGNAIRVLMGRKDDEYGITPIAIWRKLE